MIPSNPSPLHPSKPNLFALPIPPGPKAPLHLGGEYRVDPPVQIPGVLRVGERFELRSPPEQSGEDAGEVVARRKELDGGECPVGEFGGVREELAERGSEVFDGSAGEESIKSSSSNGRKRVRSAIVSSTSWPYRCCSAVAALQGLQLVPAQSWYVKNAQKTNTTQRRQAGPVSDSDLEPR
jgi:hypothetical protein